MAQDGHIISTPFLSSQGQFRAEFPENKRKGNIYCLMNTSILISNVPEEESLLVITITHYLKGRGRVWGLQWILGKAHFVNEDGVKCG